MEITGFSYSLSSLSLSLSPPLPLRPSIRHTLYFVTSNHVRSNTLVDSTRNLVKKKKKERNGTENTINKGKKSTKQIVAKTLNLFLLVAFRLPRGMHTPPSIRAFESSTILDEQKKRRRRKKIPLQAATFSQCDDPSRRAEFGSKSIGIDPF